jgi:hypothetical protein
MIDLSRYKKLSERWYDVDATVVDELIEEVERLQAELAKFHECDGHYLLGHHFQKHEHVYPNTDNTAVESKMCKVYHHDGG